MKWLLLCLSILVFSGSVYGQHYKDKFGDGQYEDYSVLTSDARSLPKMMIGFRGEANPFVLFVNADKFLIKADFAHVNWGVHSRGGAECILPFIRRSPLGTSTKIQFGGSATAEPWVYNMHMVRIKNLVKVFSFGVHVGYNYIEYLGEAALRVDYSKNYFTVNNFHGHEFALGLGLYTRRGLAVSNNDESKKQMTFRSLLFTYTADVLINTGYTYDVKRTATYGDTLEWNDDYVKFPQIGALVAFETFWTPAWRDKDRKIRMGLTCRAAVRKTFLKGLNASYYSPELMGGVYFHLSSKKSFRESSIAPEIEIWMEKHQYRPSYPY